MLVPIEWLKQYIDIDIRLDEASTPDGAIRIGEFGERMIMSGSNIETIEKFGENFSKVVVGRIMDVKAHENSDHLMITQVDVGTGENIQIVTGAPNITPQSVGLLAPVALVGSVLPGDFAIKKSKLRGVESNGMLCSAQELGFADKVVPVAYRNGIWILEGEYEVGMELCEALGLRDAVVDFEITPNRPDCLSIIGMAREAAATFGGKLRYPKTVDEEGQGEAAKYVDIQIKRPDLCRRYIARVVTDVKIAQSPWWLQKRLMLAGMRPINNIVDVTNYVMLEYGHPIHAFDIRTIEGGKIIVDTAKAGEKFTTLDGTERTLEAEMLLINDSVKPLAIAGVMGGLNSEVEGDTRTILIEAANFNESSIRKTSKALGLRTEASSRYEKGVDPELSRKAIDRVCQLIAEIGAGSVVSGAVDAYPQKEAGETISARVSRVNRVLGSDIPRSEMEKILTLLEMQVTGEGGLLEVMPPTVRRDLKSEEDIIEEIARIYGYDRLNMTLPRGADIAGMPRRREFVNFAKTLLCGAGYSEIQTYSFVSPAGVDAICAADDSKLRQFVRIINPLGEENSVMRTTLIPGMLEALAWNSARDAAEVRAFEAGSVFFGPLKDDNLAAESFSLCVGGYGGDFDFYAIKGAVQALLAAMGLAKAAFVAEKNNASFHPGRCAAIRYKDVFLGVIGEIHPDVAEKYGISSRVYICELNFDLMAENADRTVHYEPLPKYPAITRDIALVANEEVTAADMEAVIRASAGVYLESCELFDVYRGKQVPQGQKSAAFNLVYRSKEKTLTDEELAPCHEAVLAALKRELGAVLR